MPNSTIMSGCSGVAISAAFERVVQNHIPNQKWIGTKNYYGRNTRDRVNKELIGTLRKNQMEEYVASSVIIHSSDGWSYLSRSIGSLIVGDIASAIHFAYYAELRSAMSIMAYEGVGIFDKKHVWFNQVKTAVLFDRFTTHSAADKGMREWSKLASKKEVVFKLLKVNNHGFEDWIRETGFSTRSKYSNSVINSWLKKWSIDLHLYKDQQLRNEMSYRPHFDPTFVDIEDLTLKLSQIWDLLEPTNNNRFPLLDQHLLRIALEEIYRKSKGLEPIGDPYKQFITKIFGRIGEEITQPLFAFLIRERDPGDAVLLIEAKKDSNIEINKDNPLPIICRAILMLRLSTGAASELIKSSSLDKENLRYWWEHLAVQRGFISSTPSGINTVDLYTDIRDSINEINDFQSNFSNVKDAFDNFPRSLICLKQFERLAIWGLGL